MRRADFLDGGRDPGRSLAGLQPGGVDRVEGAPGQRLLEAV
jgi:hypothetical protein